MVEALLARKEAYEKYFADRDAEGLDQRAEGAYLSVLKFLYEITHKSSAQGVSAEEFRRRALEILRDDYGIDIDA